MSNPPKGLQPNVLHQRPGGLSLVDPFFNEDGPLELQKRSAANSTLPKGQNTIKWAQITYAPPEAKDTRTWWQKLTGIEQAADTRRLVKARIFANAEGRSDDTHAMIPPSTDENDNMCFMESYFEVPPGFNASDLKRDMIVQVDLFNTSEAPPLYRGLSGVAEADGRIVGTSIGEGGGINMPVPTGRSGPYMPRGCEGDEPRPLRPSGGRRSIVSKQCAQKWKKKSTDLPTTVEGEFPRNPVTAAPASTNTLLPTSEEVQEANRTGKELPDKYNEGMFKLALTDQSDYGPRVHPVTGKASYHPGIDFNARNSGIDFSAAPIYAVLDGKVVATGNSATWGRFIIIQHGPYYDISAPKSTLQGAAIYTIYAHLRRATVLSGRGVKAGQQIAISDNSGRSTGPHLHFEVIYSKKRIDPSNIDDAPRTDPMIFFNSRFKRNGRKLPSTS